MVASSFNYGTEEADECWRGDERSAEDVEGGEESRTDRPLQITHLSKTEDAPVTAHLITVPLGPQPRNHTSVTKIKMNFLATQSQRGKNYNIKKKRNAVTPPSLINIPRLRAFQRNVINWGWADSKQAISN